MNKKEITMPRLKPDMETGKLCAWLVDEGDRVTAGQPLFEVETDKVVTSVEAVEGGIIRDMRVEEGDDVNVDAVVATIEVE